MCDMSKKLGPTMKTTSLLDGRTVEYVEVHDEPLHVMQFSNEYVYAFKATLSCKGTTTQWHRHSNNTFFVGIDEGKLIDMVSDKPQCIFDIEKGKMWWSFAKSVPFIHHIELLSCGPTVCMGLEVLAPPPVYSTEPLVNTMPKGWLTIMEECSSSLGRVYSLEIPPGGSNNNTVCNWSGCGVVISLTDAPGVDGTGPFKGGDLSKRSACKWFQPEGNSSSLNVHVSNPGPISYRAIVVELIKQDT